MNYGELYVVLFIRMLNAAYRLRPMKAVVCGMNFERKYERVIERHLRLHKAS